MGTKRNNIDHLVKKLRSESLYSDKATLEIMDLCMEAALVIERQECTNKALYTELAEKDKQLAAAVECIRGVEEVIRFQRPSAVMVAIAKWRGLQETGEQPTTPATPSWAAQFERRFAGEG